MRLTLTIESRRHGHNRSVNKPDTTAAWERLVDAATRARDASIDATERAKRLNWLGGAIVLYALLTGDDAEQVRERLSAGATSEPDSAAQAMPQFREGRSTPPPPRHPGAQRPVE